MLKTVLPLIKNVIKPLAKSVLIPLGLPTPASAADAGIHKNILDASHNTVTLIICNKELGTLGACLLETMLMDKEFIRAGYGSEGFKNGKRNNN